MTLFLQICVIGSLALVAYAYVGYAIVIALAAKLFGRAPVPPSPAAAAETPEVTVLIAALNEQDVIGPRIENLLAQDYPADRLITMIASDGSTDRTPAIVREFVEKHPGRVQLLDFPNRRGKSATLNDSMTRVTSPIVVLSDANTDFAPNAVTNLARWFADPKVGAVCGKLELIDHTTGTNTDGMYWRYENALKEWESRLGANLGANGGIYAIRHDAFVPIPNDTIIDDFVIPLLITMERRQGIVYDAEAKAREDIPPNVSDEFKRRARIGAGGYQSVPVLWRLLLPHYGWLSLAFWSHKLLRWLCPLFLVIAFVGSAALIMQPLFLVLFVAQVIFYAASFVSLYVPLPRALGRFARLGGMFTSMNFALAVGFFRWLNRKQKGTWERTAR